MDTGEIQVGSTRQPEPVSAPVQVLVDCRPEHGVGHPDCPKCWAWSDRNPNARPRPEVSR